MSVIHTAEWSSAFFNVISAPLSPVLNELSRGLLVLWFQLPLAPLALPLFRLLAFMHIGTLSSTLDARDNMHTVSSWESARKQGITLWQFRLFGNPDGTIFVARKDKLARVFVGLPRPDRVGGRSLTWMDNKALLLERFSAQGIPVPRGSGCFTLASAKKVLHTIQSPVVAKPHIGSRGRHTTMHITNEQELKHAFYKAKKLSPLVVVEEELQGMVFRVTLIGGKLAGVMRREAPHVVGDGISSIQALVEKENKNPLRQGPVFHQISLNGDAHQELKRQHFTLESVPPKDKIVVINQKVSRTFGASTTDMTDETHPDNAALFERIAAFLDDDLIGIDFIIGDMTKSWKAQVPCGVIECNSSPFLDVHHYPLYGGPRDVTGMLWSLVFPVS